ncbi:HipA domain-containing protein [Ectothiorhodospira variabilis]|uniref:HipA domain-containing protein n=1 Tax=Ectothiorhodospira variabilis TaxID=505694 RepID=UPI001EFB9F67|nr:HipA domain-containing protein [Ectothiorhodospira variabilis]MCG5497513.1 HipA domain-containing protein [Ectothiorhodospira variabilis]
MRLTSDELLSRLRALGTASRAELATALGASAPTVYRRLRDAEARGKVVSFGRGPATRHALRGPLFNRADTTLPIHRVDPDGHVHPLAELVGLDQGAMLVRPIQHGPLPGLLLGEAGTGLFDDLPFFLQDLRPQGFLGRLNARALPAFPDNPEHWSTDQIGAWLLDHAVDTPGDLLLGDAALDRWRACQPERATIDDFPVLAQRVLSGGAPGSSVGGEQPKFAAQVAGHPVLVKFSPPDDGSAVAQRLRDLLVCEYLALTTLAEHGLAVAESRLLERERRFFLESVRFDRTAQGGRLPALSLLAVDAEFCGIGRGWSLGIQALARQGRVTDNTPTTVTLLQNFANWIENSDQHLGNLNLQPHPDGRLALAPVYDMLPMLHAPRPGEVPPTPVFKPPPAHGSIEPWRQGGAMALDFWRRAAADDRISSDFRAVAAERAEAVEVALTTPKAPDPSQPGW